MEETREIAIEYLEHYKKVKYGMMPEWVWNMAIKALEQEPCETVLEDIKAELQKKEFYVDSTQLAKNVYREAINDAIESIDKHIGRS